MAIVYWYHKKDDDDPSTQGYVGVTTNPSARHRQHLSDARGTRFVDKDFSFTDSQLLLLEDTEQACYELEKRLRPHKDIGWNDAPGGLGGAGGTAKSEKTKKKMSKAKLRKKSALLYTAWENTNWDDDFSW